MQGDTERHNGGCHNSLRDSMKFSLKIAAPSNDIRLRFCGDVAATVAPKKHDMFYRKNVAIKSPYEVSRH